MARFFISLFSALAILLPASAQAQTHHRVHHKVGSNPIILATQIAKEYWKATPCGGQITVRANMPLYSGLDATTDGWVTFQSSLGANNLEAPANTYTSCLISLANWQWPNAVSMEENWPMFCLTVIHEMGHLLGHPHSLAPHSVMAPVFTNEENVPAICRAIHWQGRTAYSAKRHS